MAGTLRAEATLALANLLFLVSLVLGGIVVPLDRLPAPGRLGRRGAAGCRPHAGRSRSGSGRTAGDATEPVAMLAGWAVVLAILAARRFRWD